MLLEKIRQNLNAAMLRKKEGEEGKPSSSPFADARELEVLTLRQLLAAILNKEKEKRYKISKEKPEFKETELEKESQLTDEEIIEVISSEVKKRRESIELFRQGGRTDLADKETKEKEILEKYLPEQMPEGEIKKLVQEAIAKVGAKEIKDMGKVMQELIPQIKGKADAGLVSKIVKETLGA